MPEYGRIWPLPKPEDMNDLNDLARAVVIEWDEGRLCWQGGYPSDMLIEHGKVYVATVGPDCEPELISAPVANFVRENFEAGSLGEPGEPLYQRAREILDQSSRTREEVLNA